MEKRKVIYYKDELNDEFSKAKITPKLIDGNYKYCYDSCFKKFTHFFWYRIIATPIAFLYSKIVFHHKTINKKVLKKYKKTGYFLYGNHTQDIADAFIFNMINFPKTNYVIVHPNNVSIPLIGKITPSLGALPLPDDTIAYKNFIRAINKRIKENKAIVIYPEAHIWPYYTKIRPFKDTSFHYPISLNVPSFCFTNTYQKRKHSNKVNIVTYVDGPFFSNKELPLNKQKKDLRDKIYNTMCMRSLNSNYEKIKYIKEENND
ncbi:MAG: 1-acyl-sn-glycerol-3-phosphate acyltransferase [Erysipelotrichaceae bacterium]|nr:1-acyl-sn-glycerol-3-phosphate acyltransferase [Erysipelotrichaceae bacterium]